MSNRMVTWYFLMTLSCLRLTILRQQCSCRISIDTISHGLQLPVNDPVGPFLAVRCRHFDVVVGITLHQRCGNMAFQQYFPGLAVMLPDKGLHFAVGEVS